MLSALDSFGIPWNSFPSSVNISNKFLFSNTKSGQSIWSAICNDSFETIHLVDADLWNLGLLASEYVNSTKFNAFRIASPTFFPSGLYLYDIPRISETSIPGQFPE